MKKTFDAKVINIIWDGKSKTQQYILEYKNDDKIIQVSSMESAGSSSEIGDNIKITIDEKNSVVNTNISKITAKQNVFLLFLLIFICLIPITLAVVSIIKFFN